MRVLILQHEESTPPGSTLEWCERRQHSHRVCWASEPGSWPDPQDFDLLVICGGSMNVDQEDRYPWLRREKQWIRSALQHNKKVIGLCLGAQLLAEVLGASVKKHPHWEVGWHFVRVNGTRDLMVFQWHGYSFSLPPEAEWIAHNEICANQGFSWRNQAFGFQFHPEATQEWALECALSSNLPQTGCVQTPQEIQEGVKYQPLLQDWYFAQLDQLSR